jgi:hypothetical protein
MLVVEAVSLWEIRRVFLGLWEGGEAGFPQAVRVTACEGARFVDSDIQQMDRSRMYKCMNLVPVDEAPFGEYGNPLRRP